MCPVKSEFSDAELERMNRFSTIFMALSEYYGRETSSMQIELYWQPLQKYAIADIQKAIGLHICNTETGQYFPKVADFVRLLEGGGSKDRAALAWTKVEAAINRVGTYRDIVFDDPIIHAVIRDMGGWIVFGNITLDKWPFIGNDFRARYAAYRAGGTVPQYPASLRGVSNGQNWSDSYALEPPTLFGEQTLCMQVIHGGEHSQRVLELMGMHEKILLDKPHDIISLDQKAG